MKRIATSTKHISVSQGIELPTLPKSKPLCYAIRTTFRVKCEHGFAGATENPTRQADSLCKSYKCRGGTRSEMVRRRRESGVQSEAVGANRRGLAMACDRKAPRRWPTDGEGEAGRTVVPSCRGRSEARLSGSLPRSQMGWGAKLRWRGRDGGRSTAWKGRLRRCQFNDGAEGKTSRFAVRLIGDQMPKLDLHGMSNSRLSNSLRPLLRVLLKNAPGDAHLVNFVRSVVDTGGPFVAVPVCNRCVVAHAQAA